MRENLKRLARQDRMWALLLIAAVMFPILYRFSLIGYDPNHQGFMFKTAFDVAGGKVLFRDSFTAYGALAVYLQALSVKLFGDTIAAINLSTCVAQCGVYYVVYLIVRKLANVYAAFAVIVVTFLCDYACKMVFHPWSSVYGLFMLVLAFWAWVRFAETEKSRFLVIGGGASALCFWGRQPVGIVVFLACLITMAIYRIFVKPLGWKRLGIFWGSYGAVHAVWLAVMAFQNALGEFYTQNIKGMVSFNSAKNENMTLWDSVKNLLGCLFPRQEPTWAILPLFLLIVFAVLAVKLIADKIRKREGSSRAALLACFIVFSLASWHQYYPVCDPRHIFWAAVPMIACAAVALSELFRLIFREKRLLWTLGTLAVFCALFAPECVSNVRLGIQKYQAKGEKYYNETYPFLNGLYLSPEEADFHDRMYAAVKELREEYPDAVIANMTQMGEYSCFSDVNFHPEAFYCAVMPYDFWGNLRDYVNLETPVLICYDKDYDYYGFAGYERFAAVQGNDSNIYWESGALEIYVPAGAESLDILPEMRSDTEVERTEQGVLLKPGETLYYGTHYYLKDAYQYELKIKLSLGEGAGCNLAVFSDWHSKVAQEIGLTDGENLVSLEGGWDNAQLYLVSTGGAVRVEEVRLILKRR